MKNNKVKMNTYIVDIISREYFNYFTISELKNDYMNISLDNCPIATRKYIYRQVLRLLKCGALIKKGKKNSHSATYQKTNLFNDICFIKISPKPLLKLQSDFTQINSRTEYRFNNELEITLQEYKIDMMLLIGESEEYTRLLKTYPEMKYSLKAEYLNARNNSSKLLGKIKAISTVLSLR